MNRTNIELSSNGINLKYDRFIADCVSGILLILGLIFFQIVDKNTISKEEILLSIFIILLIPALGLLINALSYFLLGFLQKILTNLFYRMKLPITKMMLNNNYYYLWKDFYNFRNDRNKNDFYLLQEGLKTIIEVYSLNIVTDSYVQGLKILLRSIALISFFFLIHSIIIMNIINTIVLTGILVFTLIFMTLVNVYLCSEIYWRTYLLIINNIQKYDIPQNTPLNIQNCIKILSRVK